MPPEASRVLPQIVLKFWNGTPRVNPFFIIYSFPFWFICTGTCINVLLQVWDKVHVVHTNRFPLYIFYFIRHLRVLWPFYIDRRRYLRPLPFSWHCSILFISITHAILSYFIHEKWVGWWVVQLFEKPVCTLVLCSVQTLSIFFTTELDLLIIIQWWYISNTHMSWYSFFGTLYFLLDQHVLVFKI